jgi:hypothetical protein
LTEYLREKGGWVSVRGLADALGWAKPEYDKARKAAVKNKLIQAQGEKTGMTLRAK